MNETKKDRSTPLWAVLTFLSATFFLFGPLSLYLTNRSEMWFGLGDVLAVCIPLGLAVLAVLWLVWRFILRRRGREWYVCLLFGLALALYVQGNYLSVFTNYGTLNGEDVDWSGFGLTAVWNTAAWLLCFAVPFVLRRLVKNWKKVLLFMSLALVGMQALALGSLLLADGDSGEKEYSLTYQDMFQLSEDENFIVFVLDHYDARDLTELLEEYPELKEDVLANFVYYPDTVCSSARTPLALPNILTGRPYTTEQPHSEYLAEGYENAPLYPALEAAGYDIGIYTESQFVSPVMADRLVNMSDGGKQIGSWPRFAYYLTRFTAVRYFPHVLKSAVWMYSGDFDKAADTSGGDDSTYIFDDALFYRKLTEECLTARSGVNAFRFYHLTGAHPIYTLDRNSQRSKGETSLEEQELGVMNILDTYFDMMKELDIYDSANIIVMADHGAYDVAQNPILLIKHGMDTASFTVSDQAVSYENVMPTMVSYLGGTVEGAKTIDQLTDGDNAERMLYLETPDNGMVYADEYVIRGPAGDPASAVKTGKRYKIFSSVFDGTEPYELGTTLYFDVRGTGNAYGVSGLSGTEADHTWSFGMESEFSFPLAESPRSDLFAEFTMSRKMSARERVRVYVNGIYLDCFSVTDKRLAFTIPEELLGGDTLDIRLSYLDAVADTWRLETSGDDGIHSLGFLSLTIDKAARGDVETERTTEPYVLGQTVPFTEADDGRRYFSFGVSALEGDFAWSLGRRGRLVMSIDGVMGDLQAELRFKMLYAAPQRLIVTAGDQILYDGTVSSAEEAVRFTVPADCVQDGWLLLDLEYPDAASPQERDGSKDDRDLAFAFSSIRLDPAQ